MTREVIVTVTRDWYELPEFEYLRKKKKKPSGDQDFMANGSNSLHGDGRGGGQGRNGGSVAETTAVAVATAGAAGQAGGQAAGQATEESQVHAENLATSATATNNFGVLSAQNCRASATRRDSA